jgi:hypothetical protein
LTEQQGGCPTEIGVQRIPVSGGFCWLCGFAAVAGEKLPGRRHKIRLLCRRHDELVFGSRPSAL